MPYSIDDIVKYTKNSYCNEFNYLVSKSEDYSRNVKIEVKIEYNPVNRDLFHKNEYNGINYNENKSTTYYFTPKIFLNQKRPKTRFISVTDEIKSLIEETFELIVNEKIPNNLIIRICNKEELKQIHSNFGSWNDNIQGFAINGKLKKIFVKNGALDEVMLTIGHEIGHVFSKNLPNKHDEEAKAFSFAVEWAQTIKKHDLGNLANCIKENIDFNPARNGLHDIAFLFVNSLINKGREAMQIHDDLVKGYISMWGFYN